MKKIFIILFLFIAVVANSQIPQHMMHTLAGQTTGGGTTLKEGLISIWELNETSGTDAFDAHGSNDGTNVGATVNQTSVANLGTSYDFDGNNDYINIGSPIDLSTLSAISISTWVYLTSWVGTGEWPALVSFGEGNLLGNRGIMLRLRQAGDGFDMDAGSPWYTGRLEAKQTEEPSLPGWFHVVGTLTESDAYLYVNGIEVAHNTTVSGTFQFSNLTDDSFVIGKDSDRNDIIDGKIDQPAIWDRALTPDEISSVTPNTSLYNSGNGLPYTSFGIEWFMFLLFLRKRNYDAINNLKIVA